MASEDTFDIRLIASTLAHGDTSTLPSLTWSKYCCGGGAGGAPRPAPGCGGPDADAGAGGPPLGGTKAFCGNILLRVSSPDTGPKLSWRIGQAPKQQIHFDAGDVTHIGYSVVNDAPQEGLHTAGGEWGMSASIPGSMSC